jgi:iron(III) transport system substrate-binding protein
MGALVLLVVILAGVAAYGFMRTPVGTGTGTTATVTTEIPMSLVDLAKKEGKLIIYGVMDAPDFESVVKPEFLKTYPWADVEYLGMDTSEITTKVISEFKAGKVSSDIEMTNLAPAVVVNQAGAAESYINPMIQLMNYPEGSYDPEGYWQVGYGIPIVILYNTNLVKAEELPTTTEGFADPKWMGKFVLDDPALESASSEFFAHTYTAMGEEKWTKLMEAIAANKPIIAPSSSDVYTMIAMGQAQWGLGLFNDYLGGKAENYPVGVVWVEPHLMHPSPMVINKNCPHPYMAQLYTQWITTIQGQTAIAKTGRTPAHPMVQSTMFSGLIPPGIDMQVASITNPDFYANPAVWGQRFKEIFRA